MNSNKRIKELRKALKLTQTEFGERISLSRNAINNYEQLRANVPPPTEMAIAAEYDVNLEWLRTGKGEMFCKPANTFIDELAEKYKIDDFVKKALVAYMSLSDSDKKAVRRFIENMTPPPSGEMKIYRAASSKDNHPDEITTLSKEESERLAKAPRMTSENCDL